MHRRPLHEDLAGREVRSGGSVGAALRRHEARLGDHRPQLPDLPPGWHARRLQRPERHVAPAQLQRRPLPQRAKASWSAASRPARRSARARRPQERAEGHLDGPRLGGPRLGLLLGRVRGRVPRARRHHRRQPLLRSPTPVSVPEGGSRASTLDPPMATDATRPREAEPRRARGPVGRGLGSERHLPLRPHQDPRRDLLDRHPTAHRVGVAPHRARLQLHAHRRHRPLPADARAGGLLPDGVGRQRRPHRAPGRELLRRPLRPVAPLRPRLHAARVPGQGLRQDVPAELRRALHRADDRGRAGLRGDLATARPVGRLVDALPDDQRPGAGHGPAGVPPQPEPRRGVPGRGADPLGHHLRHGRLAGRARGPRGTERLPPHVVPPDRRAATRS